MVLVVTGYTSQIVIELLARLHENNRTIEIVKCGRKPDADVPVDFSDISAVRDFIKRLREMRPSHLFVNHGILPGKKLGVMGNDTIVECVNVNLVSYLMIIEAVSEFSDLRTIVMSSISGKKGSYDTLYAACKAGVDAAIRQYAVLLPPSSRLNAVSPGIIKDARMTLVRKDTDILAAKMSQTPTRKFTTSAEIARLVEYMLFEAENMQGVNININGGLYIQ